MFGGESGAECGRAAEIRGAGDVLQSPAVHATAEGGGGGVRIRSEGDHHHSLPRGGVQARAGHD